MTVCLSHSSRPATNQITSLLCLTAAHHCVLMKTVGSKAGAKCPLRKAFSGIFMCSDKTAAVAASMLISSAVSIVYSSQVYRGVRLETKWMIVSNAVDVTFRRTNFICASVAASS